MDLRSESVNAVPRRKKVKLLPERERHVQSLRNEERGQRPIRAPFKGSIIRVL